MRSAISLQRPDLHFTEPLSAKLGLASQGLLRNKGVWASAPCMYLILHKMVKLQHIHTTDCDILIKRLSGSAVIKGNRAVKRQTGLLKKVFYVLLRSAIKHRT